MKPDGKNALKATCAHLLAASHTGRRARSVAVILACWMFPVLASAESLTIRTEPVGSDQQAGSEAQWNVFLEGEIDTGAAARLRDELSEIDSKGANVYIASTGGSLFAALQMGALLRQLGASTTVGRPAARASGIEPAQCFSACVFVFLGGIYRYMPSGSVLGVHRVSTSSQSTRNFDLGQLVSAAVSRYIVDMGVSQGLFDRMASIDKDRIRILSADELDALGIVNNGRQRAQWSLESSSQGPHLMGVQQTAQGVAKAIFDCAQGRVFFHSIYEARANAATVASGEWIHSLMVDGVASPLDVPIAIEDANGFLDATFTLSSEQARQLTGASSLGHAMRGHRGDASLGYKIDIDPSASSRIRGFMEFCIAGSE